MDPLERKIECLANAAKYDVSCSSSGSKRKRPADGIGSTEAGGICHSWTEDGRCVSLLKILLTNHCIYDCEYCINRRSNDIPRERFEVEEIVKLTIEFYRRNYIEGLFLSSGVYKSPDDTMSLLIDVAQKLRAEEHFHGYIHMKSIPGASKQLVEELGHLVDRLSINIELPTEQSLKILAPQKNKQVIYNDMSIVRDHIAINREEQRKYKHASPFVPAGQTTQMIIGAMSESDYEIIKESESLYQSHHLKRVYYSAFIPVVSSAWTSTDSAPLMREHRIYQADWLMRFYEFQADEILSREHAFFDVDLDPKAHWAVCHYDRFPVEINTAPYSLLLRVPGIGPTSAKRIVNARKLSHIQYDQLKKIGVVLKRARFFITCNGIYRGEQIRCIEDIRDLMVRGGQSHEQLSFLKSS